MKILETAKVFSYDVQFIQFDDACPECSIAIGSLIPWLFMRSNLPENKNVSFGDGVFYDENTFPSVFEDVGKYHTYINNCKSWTAHGEIDGREITIRGGKGDVFSVSVKSGEDPFYLGYLADMEDSTFEYTRLSAALINRMKKTYGLNQVNSVKTIKKLMSEPDIYGEFISGFRENGFVFPVIREVNVHGYTARRLYEENELSTLGAYTYLVYLRRDYLNAADDLKYISRSHLL